MAFLSSRISVVSTRGFATTAPAMQAAIKYVTVIGGGHMGSGIAQVAAHSGHSVTITDISEDVLNKSLETVRTSLQRVAKKQFEADKQAGESFVSTTLSRISLNTNLEKAVENADLVVEAIVENLDVKRKLFASIDKAAPQKTIFASNTSSISIAAIASATERLDRFGGLHFFGPVPVMKLLEVVRIPETSEDTYKSMMEFGKAVGKSCITCKDTPGFIVNRLLVPYVNEAISMLERGDATAKDIDVAMKLGAGYPLGPFELADYVGLDIIYNCLDGWSQRFPDNPVFRPSPVLAKLFAEGKLGRKTGEGFYSYDKK